VTPARPIPRYLSVLVLIAMAGFAAVGLFAIRKDVDHLRVISQDNTLWSASQMEIELLRFRLSLNTLRSDRSPVAMDEMRKRLDILWSRVSMMGDGRVGEILRRYDEGYGSIAAIGTYLEEIDPVFTQPDGPALAAISAIEEKLYGFQQKLRQYTLRVIRADALASAAVRDRIQGSAQTTAVISIAAVLLSVLSLLLILRENRRQHEVAEINRRVAAEAEQSSRAKSQFLSMMSHELRNPLNGVLGPLALLGQSDLAGRHKRLVDQAQQSGQAMVQMLAGLLDFAEMQDGRFRLRPQPVRVAALAESVQAALAREGAAGLRTRVLLGTPERVRGDPDRLRQIFVNLSEYLLESREPTPVTLTFGHDGRNLVGEIAFSMQRVAIDWRLDLLMGLTEVDPDQVSTDALRPLIARGLIQASEGVLTLLDEGGGRRAIRVAIPAEALRFERIRVHLETRSAALATIYKAALKSDRVVFASPDSPGPVDVVLVDSTSVGEDPLMARLRQRFPNALLVALGQPQSPDFFDDIVETPNDMSRLRTSILGRLAS
jgi:signal transduction histidine kinase